MQVIINCSLLEDWEQAYQASLLGLSLLPELAFKSLQTSDKQHMLSQAFGIASNAAAAALMAGKGPLAALNMLEQGRGILTCLSKKCEPIS